MLTVLAAAAGAVAVLMLLVWLLSLRLKDVSIVDPVWGFAYASVGKAPQLTDLCTFSRQTGPRTRWCASMMSGWN